MVRGDGGGPQQPLAKEGAALAGCPFFVYLAERIAEAHRIDDQSNDVSSGLVLKSRLCVPCWPQLVQSHLSSVK